MTQLASILILVLSVCCIVAGFALRYETRTRKDAEARAKEYPLHKELCDILDIAIQYPYLEDREWTKNWDSTVHDEDHVRYDLYCTRVFNYLERFCQCHGYDRQRIEGELDMKTWVRIHRRYWCDPIIENDNDAYENAFKNIVKHYLDEGDVQ